MSRYPKFNGSHFGLAPSSVNRMTGLGGHFVWKTIAYVHRPSFARRFLKNALSTFDILLLMYDCLLHMSLCSEKYCKRRYIIKHPGRFSASWNDCAKRCTLARPQSTVDTWCIQGQTSFSKIWIGLKVNRTQGLVDSGVTSERFENTAREKTSTQFGTKQVNVRADSPEKTCVYIDGNSFAETPCSQQVSGAVCACQAHWLGRRWVDEIW